MRIAVIGAGNVGTNLGSSWEQAGHEVTYGVRNPKDKKYAALADKGMQLKDVREAAAGAEVVVFATPWPATKAAIEECGKLAGKIVVDCTNPLKEDLSGLAIGLTTSAGEQVAGWAKGASVYKAFNTTGADNMSPTAIYPVKAVMFVCGDDAEKKPKVLELVKDVGFDARDAGGMEVSRLLEPLAMLWIHLTIRQGFGKDWAFAVMNRTT
jgi:predicted dinucleotide-binding enzyme